MDAGHDSRESTLAVDELEASSQMEADSEALHSSLVNVMFPPPITKSPQFKAAELAPTPLLPRDSDVMVWVKVVQKTFSDRRRVRAALITQHCKRLTEAIHLSLQPPQTFCVLETSVATFKMFLKWAQTISIFKNSSNLLQTDILLP
jgi:hypothetical protein